MTRPAHILSLLLIASLAACAEDVAAPSDLDEPFSIFGIINPRLETQSMLVSPVEPLLFDYPDTIDASVTSTDLETGEVVAWRDSAIIGERGERDHIYWADLRPAFGHDYLIEATRSDGAYSSAVAHVPEEVTVLWENTGSAYFNVDVRGSRFHLLSTDVVYTVRYYAGGTTTPCSSPARAYPVSYTGRERRTDDGYRIEIHLDRDHGVVMGAYSAEQPISWVPGRTGLALTGVTIRLLVADEAWNPPGGKFDRRALAQPGVMANVMNGYGLVAGGYNDDRNVYPSSDIIDASWFFDYLMRPPGDCLNYCSCGLQ